MVGATLVVALLAAAPLQAVALLLVVALQAADAAVALLASRPAARTQ
jgi:hypothetical protein